MRSAFGAALGSAALAGTGCGLRSARPNILVILSDDQGWGDLSVHGNTNLSTPNIDSLARDGAIFDHFFVCAVCAPTRAEFLTGRYHARGGVRGVSTGAERLNLDERTIANVFADDGYATACFGKWHNGSQYPYHPNGRGFQEYYGFTSGHWGDYFDPELDHNGEVTQGKGYLTDDLTDHAIDFMTKPGKSPFFCYLPLNVPHSPMQVPDRFYQKFANFNPLLRASDESQEDLAMTRAALAMCENIEWNVGRILEALDKAGKAEDTIIVYFGDNGPNSWRWNGGMKGRKGTLDEGGLKVPCLMRWKGHIPAGVHVTRIAGAIDLMPTLVGLAGVSAKPTKDLDGLDLRPLLLQNAEDTWEDRQLFTLHNNRASVRTQRYRLDPEGALYDMLNDPRQTQDVSAEAADIASELREASAAWLSQMQAERGDEKRPFPVGFGTNTLLPARDGVPKGGIQRSSRHPNCSFFTNWLWPDDAMEWSIEVGRSGLYEATIYYTCPWESVGSKAILEFEGQQVEWTIQEAHDPPLEGAADDRVPRAESYVKAFRPALAGQLAMKQSTGVLRLRAVDISGKPLADIRQIGLRFLSGAVV